MSVQFGSATTLGALASQTLTLPVYTLAFHESLRAAPLPLAPGRASLGVCHSYYAAASRCLDCEQRDDILAFGLVFCVSGLKAQKDACTLSWWWFEQRR